MTTGLAAKKVTMRCTIKPLVKVNENKNQVPKGEEAEQRFKSIVDAIKDVSQKIEDGVRHKIMTYW